MFDPTLTTPRTILHLGADDPDEPIQVEFWRQLGLETEHLQVNDQIEIEFENFWAQKNCDRSQEPGQYRERWICRSIYSMSRERIGPPRVPPPQPAIWGEFEKGMYAMHLASVHGNRG